MKAILALVKPTVKVLLKAEVAEAFAGDKFAAFALRLKLTDEQIDGIQGWVNNLIDKF